MSIFAEVYHTWMMRFLLIAALPAALLAQTEPAVIGVGGFSHIVANVEKSIEFYRDLLGLELPTPPRPFGSVDWITKMGNTPGTQSRPANMRISGSALGVELIDYKDIDRKAAQPRIQDPGAANLILSVRDLHGLLAKLKKAGTRIVTPSGVPAVLEGNGTKTHVIFVQDPDGFFVELTQRDPTPETKAPASSNVIGGNFEIVVNDMEQTMHIYRDILGFQPQVGMTFTGDKLRTDTIGAPGSQFRQSRSTIPGTNVSMAFLEFKDIDRKPLHSRVQDPGTAILQLRVADADGVTKALKAAGCTVISEGGVPVTTPNGGRFVMVRDPNNLFLELFQR